MVTVPLYFSLSQLDHTKAHSVSRKLCDLLQNVCVYSGTVHASILSSFGFSVLSHSVPTLALIFFPFWLFITKTEASSWTLYVSYHFLFGPSFPPSSDIWTLHPASFSYSFQLLFYSTLKVKTKEESENKTRARHNPHISFLHLCLTSKRDKTRLEGDRGRYK